jgi:hypothetical protein
MRRRRMMSGQLSVTAFGVKCQEVVAAWGRDLTRPVEEQVISMPFGGIPGEDDSTSNEYDGEDSWGDVARYGT